MKYKPDLQEHIPLLVFFDTTFIEVDFPFSYNDIEYSEPSIVLDMDLASLVEACSKRVLRGELQLSEDEILCQPAGESSRSASSRIALIHVRNVGHFDGKEHVPKFICCPEKETKVLSDLLIQAIHGDNSQGLAQEAHQKYSRIIENAGRGSIEYEEVDCSIKEYLAKIKLGYRFLDENGAVI
ncbi:hypothetical protein K445DRAFT_316439, partial [Daldinia sp. EC12]